MQCALVDTGGWSVRLGATVVKAMVVTESQECVSATLAGNMMR